MTNTTTQQTEKDATLATIEAQIIDLTHKDIKGWTEMAELIIRVQNEKLYESQNISFTKWVRQLSNKAHVHESLLWRRLKAGRFYLRVKAAEEKKGRKKLPEINHIQVSPDNFILIKDIVGNDEGEATLLIQKLLNGQITRKELSAARDSIVKQRERTGIKHPANGYDRDKVQVNSTDEISAKTGITAAKLLLTLQQRNDWINDIEDTQQECQQSSFIRSKYKDIYRVLPEFPVETGDTQKARRIDAFVLENITSPTPTQMTLRAIEIKVSKSDLLRDQKMSEYTDFCDFFYIAIPPELEADARTIMMPNWGLLLIHDEIIEVAVSAKKSDGILRNEALSTALYELL